MASRLTKCFASGVKLTDFQSFFSQLKPFGSEYFEFPTDCYETWSTFERVSDDIDPKLKRLESVQCHDKNFFFSPNGRFHKATLHGDVSNISKYKDSLSLSEGKCSTL